MKKIKKSSIEKVIFFLTRWLILLYFRLIIFGGRIPVIFKPAQVPARAGVDKISASTR